MPFNPDVVIAMAFAITVMLILGGFIVAIPIIRRLGKLTDAWVTSRRGGIPGDGEWARLVSHLESIDSRLSQIERDQSHMSDRQEFVEGLVTGAAQQRAIGVGE